MITMQVQDMDEDNSEEEEDAGPVEKDVEDPKDTAARKKSAGSSVPVLPAPPVQPPPMQVLSFMSD